MPGITRAKMINDEIGLENVLRAELLRVVLLSTTWEGIHLSDLPRLIRFRIPGMCHGSSNDQQRRAETSDAHLNPPQN